MTFLYLQLTINTITIAGDGVTDILQIVRDSVGDVSSTGQSYKTNDHRSLLSPTEKQRVIQYSSYELEEHEEASCD